MTDTSFTRSSAETIRVQPGWQIFSRDGASLGEVVAVDREAILVRGTDLGAGRYRIPADSIIEQEEAEMRARTSLTSHEMTGTE